MSSTNRNNNRDLHAIEKIEEVLSGKSDIFASEEVAEWFSTKEGNNFLGDEMDKHFMEEDECKVDHPIPSEIMWNSIVKRHRNRKRMRYFSAAVATLILLCGGDRKSVV